MSPPLSGHQPKVCQSEAVRQSALIGCHNVFNLHKAIDSRFSHISSRPVVGIDASVHVLPLTCHVSLAQDKFKLGLV